ncbi:Cell cycle control protein 50A [Bulinus truncatus]|nr:Cell cycle control protein 50A [Bulinus truncatus]
MVCRMMGCERRLVYTMRLSKRETKFKQQNLPAWQPILTASTVLPAFFAIGVAFIPLGVALLITSNNVKEHIIDYTYCKMKDNSITCAEFFNNVSNTGETCHCTYENVTLSDNFQDSVYIYYGLTNFYQNHRRYVRSRDDDQLHGDSKSPSSLNDDCDPYKTVTINGSVYGYAPCGAIANSLFNDSFTIKYLDKNVDVGLIRTGIAWVSDKNVKFKNATIGSNFVKPPNWNKNVTELDPEIPSNNGYLNEDLIVWMRTAALPTFRKLYRRVNHTMTDFADGLPAGSYRIDISYNYPVTAFDGTKSIIISTTSWLGGKNSFLGIAYIVVGSLCVILGMVFLLIHIKWGKKMLDCLDDEEYFNHYYMGNTVFNIWHYPSILCDSFTRCGSGFHYIMSRIGRKESSLIAIMSPSRIEQTETVDIQTCPDGRKFDLEARNNVGLGITAHHINSCFDDGPDSNIKSVNKTRDLALSKHETFSVDSGPSDFLSPVSITVIQTRRIPTRRSHTTNYAHLQRKSSFTRDYTHGSNFGGFAGSLMAQKLKELKVIQDNKAGNAYRGPGDISEDYDKMIDLPSTSDFDGSPERISLNSSITTHTSADSWMSRGIQVNMHTKARRRVQSNKAWNKVTPNESYLLSGARGGPVALDDVSCSMISLRKISRERLECWIPISPSPRNSHSLRFSQSSLFLPTPEQSRVESLICLKSEDDLIDEPPTASHLDVTAYENLIFQGYAKSCDNVSDENQNKRAVYTNRSNDNIVLEDLDQNSYSNNNFGNSLQLNIEPAQTGLLLTESDTVHTKLNFSQSQRKHGPAEILEKLLTTANGLNIEYSEKDIYVNLINEGLIQQANGAPEASKPMERWSIMISVAVQTDVLEEY